MKKKVYVFVADGTCTALAVLLSGLIAAGDGTGAVHFLELVE